MKLIQLKVLPLNQEVNDIKAVYVTCPITGNHKCLLYYSSELLQDMVEKILVRLEKVRILG